LDADADRLAQRLRALGAGPGVIVGVYLERSLHLPAALLGVLKAGAAYLPLDPVYPPERTAFVLADARAAIVLTQRRLRAALPEAAPAVLCIDDAAAPSAPAAADPGQLAYVIYTSGSTGRPKGVALTHAGLSNLVHAQAAAFG